MSISTKLYNKIGCEDVYPGMVLRIITEGPDIKSDVEGTVASTFTGGHRHLEGNFVLYDYQKVAFRSDQSTSHVIKYPDYEKNSVELYEVIDAIPDEPTGLGAVVHLVNLTYPDRNMGAVKTDREGSWAWEGTVIDMPWGSITECVLSQGYDYIKVLSKGVEL